MKIKRNSFDKQGFCSLAAVSWEGLSPAWLAETELRAQVVTGPPSREAGPVTMCRQEPSRRFWTPRRLRDAQPRAGEQRLTCNYCFIPSQAHGKADGHLPLPAPGSVSQALLMPPGPAAEPCSGLQKETLV